ncbi:uncharacterized protein LOC142339254 isoform X2 [Convolutriloba macropyga]|uniref:uncharacterized protein LOC142339254 isoform X2 n=1 Tax=Convolutriloba macropyga TaxID=536237 RepID=UPI003F525128
MSASSGSDEWEEVARIAPPPKKNVTFFWFRDSEVQLPQNEQLSSVWLRLYAPTEEIDVELRLDEATDVYESQPVATQIGSYEGILVVTGGVHSYPLNKFEVFPNRNRVVLKINTDAIQGLPKPNVELNNNEDDKRDSSESEDNQLAKSVDKSNSGDHKQLLISVSDDEFRSSEDEDPTTVVSSADDEPMSVSYVETGIESYPSVVPSNNLLHEENRIDEEEDYYSDENYRDSYRYGMKETDNDEWLNIPAANNTSNIDVSRMVQKYSPKESKLTSSAPKGSGSADDLAPTTPGRSTPSTVIDIEKRTPVSTPRHSDEEKTTTELEVEIQELHKKNTEKDNEILKLKTDLLEAQRSTRNLKAELEDKTNSIIEFEEAMNELKRENDLLKQQLAAKDRSYPASPQRQKQEAAADKAKIDALTEELNLHKHTISDLHTEKELLNKKVEMLQMSLNQTKTFSTIDEEGESQVDSTSEPVVQKETRQVSQSSPEHLFTSSPALGSSPGIKPPEIKFDSVEEKASEDVKPHRRSDIPKGIQQYMQNGPHKKNQEILESERSKDSENFFQNSDEGSKSNKSVSEAEKKEPGFSPGNNSDSVHAPDLSYTKSNITFLRERLGDLKAKNQDLHDRYSKLEEASTLSSPGDRKCSPGNKEFGSLTDISVAKNPLAGNMNAQQRHSFMEQRKAALAELEQIRNNLASVRSELRHEEAKSKEHDWVRLHDNFDKLKKPSELFGSLIQISEDKRKQQFMSEISDIDSGSNYQAVPTPGDLGVSSSYHNSPSFVNGVAPESGLNTGHWNGTSNWEYGKRDNSSSYNRVPSHSSTAESVVERQIDRLNAASTLYNFPSLDQSKGASSFVNGGAESDSTDVLLSINPMVTPRPLEHTKPLQAGNNSAWQQRVKSPIRSKQSRSATRGKRNKVSSSSAQLRKSKLNANQRSSSVSSSDEVVSSDSTLVSGGEDGAIGKKGTKRNPDSLYEERLNKSYPSLGDSNKVKGKKRGYKMDLDSVVVDDVDSSTSTVDVESTDGWMPAALQSSALSHNRRLNSGDLASFNTSQKLNLDTKYMDLKKNRDTTNNNRSSDFRRHGSTNVLTTSGGEMSGSSAAFSSPKFYVPKVPSDVRKGDRVKFSRKGGKVSHGVIKYVGRLPGRTDFYLGVELESGVGKHDGTYHGKRLFNCAFRKGVFVSFDKIILCYGLLS